MQDSGDSVRGQVLVVTRLGPGGVCHVGYVDGRANPNANELAVQLADTRARNFKCGKDKPVIVGEKGPGFSGHSYRMARHSAHPQRKRRECPAASRAFKARHRPDHVSNSIQLFQAKATFSRLRSPKRSDERATALPPSAR